LTVLAALLAGWIAGRWPLLQRDVQLAVAQAESAQQLADDMAQVRSRLRQSGLNAAMATKLASVTPHSGEVVLTTPAEAAVLARAAWRSRLRRSFASHGARVVSGCAASIE